MKKLLIIGFLCFAYSMGNAVEFRVCPKGTHQVIYVDKNSTGRPIEKCEKYEKK